MPDFITIKGARLHNLKNVSLQIPRNQFVVFTGLSGSGKSTLAFDTIHQEGQRQYLESLGLVTDYVQKPLVDSIEGLSPSISVDQHLTNRSPRSTVGTATEVFTYLRVLFARLGVRPCPHCGQLIPPPLEVEATLETENDSEDVYPCPHCGQPVPVLGMAHFSFNKPAGACPTCTGLGEVYDANLDLLLDPSQSIAGGGVVKWDRYEIARYGKAMQAAGKHYGFTFDTTAPISAFGEVQRDLLLYGVHHPQFRRHFPNVEPPETSETGRVEGIITNLLRRYQEHANDASYREKLGRLLIQAICPDCQGTRLRPESRVVTVAGRTLIEVSHLPLTELADWIEQIDAEVPAEKRTITDPITIDLRERIRRLVEVGVGYLTLDRSSPTLSAGEAQRLRLAALLGSGLTGVLYVLDEPTTGLHQRDTERLIQVLRQLRDLGNTVLVVEHDIELIRAADYVVDIGPGAGQHGGQIIAAGSPAELAQNTHSITGKYLLETRPTASPVRRRGNGNKLVIRGARAHNLKNVTVEFPLGRLIALTGVSGSGKSSLMFDILDRAAQQHFYHASAVPGSHDRIEGWEHLDDAITIDQIAIGRSPRSNAATYTDVFTDMRNLFAGLESAHQHGLTPGHFSFNTPGGRCERCQGAGVLVENMYFLPDVEVRCPACRGRRFKPEILAVQYRGRSIADILNLTIEEALDVFQSVPTIAHKLALMVDVGLGYLPLGQPATTFSGGEAQRIKLAKELGRRVTGRTLYLLDEPTTGLHPADVAHLLDVLHRLVEAGNTVAVIEHNLDVIQAADWIIDLGPEGGSSGGEIIDQGTPEDIARRAQLYTGQYLRTVLPAW